MQKAITELRALVRERLAKNHTVSEAECKKQSESYSTRSHNALSKIPAELLRQKSRFADHAPHLGWTVEEGISWCITSGCLLADNDDDPDNKEGKELVIEGCGVASTVLDDLERDVR